MCLIVRSILFFLLVPTACCAQDSVRIVPHNQLFLKVNPLAIFETDGGIGFSAEYLFPKAKLGVQLEVQPIFLQ